MPSCSSKSNAQSMQCAICFMIYHACNLEIPTLYQKGTIQNTANIFNSSVHKPMKLRFWQRKPIQEEKKRKKKLDFISVFQTYYNQWKIHRLICRIVEFENCRICRFVNSGYTKLCIMFKARLLCLEKSKLLDYSGAVCYEYYWTFLPHTASGWLSSIKPLFATTTI